LVVVREDRADQTVIEREVRALDTPLLRDPHQIVFQVGAAQADLGCGQEPLDLLEQLGLDRRHRVGVGAEVKAVGSAGLEREADRDDLLVLVPGIQAHGLGIERDLDRLAGLRPPAIN
jgi:hypothetical protein